MKDKKISKKGDAKSLLKFAGALKDANIDWEEVEKRMKEFREDFEKKVRETSEYMRKSRKN